MDRLSLVLAVSTLADAAGVVVFAVLSGTRRWLWAAFAAVAWLVKLVALGIAGLEPLFGAAHLVWLDVIIVIPLAGALLAVRGRPTALRILGGLAVLLAPAGAYASLIEPSRLEVTRVTVPIAPQRDAGSTLRVGVIADLQFERVTEHERNAVDRLMRLEPDLILVPGDVHQGADAVLREELPEIRKLLGRLRAPGGVFLVQGDQEKGDEAELVARGTGVRVLDDEVIRTEVVGRRVTIAGVSIRYRDPPALRALRELEQRPEEGDLRLVLAHRPDTVVDLPLRTRADLVVAGHTHGGQLQLPLIGPLFTASELPRDVGAGGLHEVGEGRRVFVTRGVGVERGQAPKLRFLAPPEVVLLTFAPAP